MTTQTQRGALLGLVVGLVGIIGTLSPLIAVVCLGYWAATRQPITRGMWVFTVVWLLFSVLAGRMLGR